MFARILKNRGIKIVSCRIDPLFRKYSTNEDHLIKVNVTTSYGENFQIKGEYDDSLFDIIKKNTTINIDLLKDCLECNCEGVMACSSCHVYIEEDWFKTINTPTEDEEDILDLIYNRQNNSKLGCQLKLKPYLNGINITIPDKSNKYL